MPATLPSYPEAFLGNTQSGSPFYTNIPGCPALYENCEGRSRRWSVRLITFSGITVVNSSNGAGHWVGGANSGPLPILGRHDLAHVAPEEIGNTVLGGGVAQDKAPGRRNRAGAASVVSRGLVRSKTDKLMIVRSGTMVQACPGRDRAERRNAGPAADMGGVSFAPAVETAAEKRAEARMKGYVGEACRNAGILPWCAMERV